MSVVSVFQGKIAFYAMNSKGYFVLSAFIKEFGPERIEYIVGAQDKALAKDFYEEIKNLAAVNGIKFFDKEKIDKYLESKFDGLKFSIGWRWLIDEDVGLIVIHDSLLPKFRGFAPLVNLLIKGESIAGVTGIFASSEYDRGDIVSQRKIDIEYPITILDLIKKIEPLYFDVVRDVCLNYFSNKTIKKTIQNDDESSYSPWLDQDDYFIDWSWSAGKIRRFVDAVGFPYEGAKSKVGDDIVIIRRAEEVEDVEVENRDRHIGKVIFFRDGCPVVICSEGLLSLVEVEKDGDVAQIKFRSRFC